MDTAHQVTLLCTFCWTHVQLYIIQFYDHKVFIKGLPLAKLANCYMYDDFVQLDWVTIQRNIFLLMFRVQIVLPVCNNQFTALMKTPIKLLFMITVYILQTEIISWKTLLSRIIKKFVLTNMLSLVKPV